MRPITEIILHCAATPPDWRENEPVSAKVDAIRAWHKQRGWRDIGYHYVIDRDGTAADGRPLEQIGAHVKGHNRGTIGICLLGGKGGSEMDQFGDHFTREQDFAARRLIARLRRDFPAISKVSGHNEYAAKACPCFQVGPWYATGPDLEPMADDNRPAPQAASEEPQGWLAIIIAFILRLIGKG